ncbi:hypothetical protein RQP46_008239 [Phenoliferia psychrophenolica]
MQLSGKPGTGFTMARSYLDGSAWLIPDFGFYSWPEPVTTGYKGVWRKIEQVEREVTWENKIPKLFWRGAFLAPIRDALRKAAEGMPWGDIGGIQWRNKGKGLKYLLNCRSVIIAHELHWDQHFHAAFDSNSSSPNQNIIILQGNDWDELGQTMTFLEENPERAELIAANAWRTLHGRYLSPASVACYWRRVLRAYATVQTFVPEIGDGKDYESFMLMGKTFWDPS